MRYFIWRQVFIRGISFIKKNKIDFDTVFCFGNMPPLTQLNSKVSTHFHNSIYIKETADFNYSEIIKHVLKVFLIRRLLENTDKWWAQTGKI